MKTGLVHVNGPFTKEEKASLDKLRKEKASFLEDIAGLKEDLKSETSAATRTIIEDEIRHCEEMVEMIRTVVPD